MTPRRQPDGRGEIIFQAPGRRRAGRPPGIIEKILPQPKSQQTQHDAEQQFISPAGKPAGVALGQPGDQTIQVGGHSGGKIQPRPLGLGRNCFQPRRLASETGLGRIAGQHQARPRGVRSGPSRRPAPAGGLGRPAALVAVCAKTGPRPPRPTGPTVPASGLDTEMPRKPASQIPGRCAAGARTGSIPSAVAWPSRRFSHDRRLASSSARVSWARRAARAEPLMLDGRLQLLDRRERFVEPPAAVVQGLVGQVEEVCPANPRRGRPGKLASEQVPQGGEVVLQRRAARLFPLGIGQCGQRIDQEYLAGGVMRREDRPPVVADVLILVGMGLDEDQPSAGGRGGQFLGNPALRYFCCVVVTSSTSQCGSICRSRARLVAAAVLRAAGSSSASSVVSGSGQSRSTRSARAGRSRWISSTLAGSMPSISGVSPGRQMSVGRSVVGRWRPVATSLRRPGR